MFHFKTNVSFQNKCFASKQLFHFKTNVSFQNKCFISRQMFHFKTNVSFQNKCFASKQMFSFQNKCLVFKTNVSFLYHESYTTCYALSSFILRLIPSAYNQVVTALPPCFANSALDKFNHIENCYSTFSSDTNENSG